MNSQDVLRLISDPLRQKIYRAHARAAVGKGGHNACAATASQPYLELGVLKHIELMAEGLANACKRSGRFESAPLSAGIEPGDLIVCADENGNGVSDHVLHILADLGGGWFSCFDNGSRIGYRRRLDGADGRTPARGRLRLTH